MKTKNRIVLCQLYSPYCQLYRVKVVSCQLYERKIERLKSNCLVSYIATVVLFCVQSSRSTNQNSHAKSQMSKVQRKLFTTVLLILLCYCVFYVLPSTSQMLQQVSF